MIGIRVMLAALTSLATASAAHAQLSANLGIAAPARNEADVYDNGIHLGVGLKLPIVPLQLEAALDRMGGEGELSDLTIFSAGAIVPLSVTPPLVPVSIYALAGGGLYNVDADEAATDAGITGGAGLRLRLPGFSPFVEGRGVLIFGDNKVTYLTAAIGARF